MFILFWIMTLSGQIVHGQMEIYSDCDKAEKTFVQKFSALNPLTQLPIATDIYTLCIKNEGGQS